MRVSLAASSERDGTHVRANPERMINRYVEPTETGLRLRCVPGQRRFASIGNVITRALTAVNGILYAVGGRKLYRINPDGSLAILGDVVDGATVISGDRQNVTVAAGGKYYVFDGATLSIPSGGVVGMAGSVEQIAQRTIITEWNTDRFEWTDTADPKSRDGLQFATAEYRSDPILKAVVTQSYLWLVGSETIEVWATDGTTFERLPGGTVDRGALLPELIARHPEGLFLVGNDGIPYLTMSLSPEPLRNAGLITAIQQSIPTHVFYYEARGHRFLCIRFEDRPAWCYDTSTRVWHERSTGADRGPWEVIATAEAYGKWFCATVSGDVFEMAETGEDVNYPLVREVTSRNTIWPDRRSVNQLELYPSVGMPGVQTGLIDAGTGLLATEGEIALVVEGAEVVEPGISIQSSRDGGNTWSRPRWRGLGATGKYKSRIQVNGLGRFDQFAVRVTDSSPVNVDILAEMEVK